MKALAADVTPVLEAIESARTRMLAMPSRTPDEVMAYGRAVLDEMGKIIAAKNKYDDDVEFFAKADEIMAQLFPAGMLIR